MIVVIPNSRGFFYLFNILKRSSFNATLNKTLNDCEWLTNKVN